MSNFSKTAKNGIYGFIGQLILYLFKFIDRRVFLQFLNVELLGYRSLFGDIFSLLSLAELGIGSIIVYNLYKEFANHNESNINKLMSIYRYIYSIIGISVMGLGVVFSFFIKELTHTTSYDWTFLYIVYYLMLFSTVASYFLSYRSTLYIVSQKEYKLIEINVLVNSVFSIIKIVLLIITKNFIIYLVIDILYNIVYNLVIFNMSSKDFTFLDDKYRVTVHDLREMNVFKDVRNILCSKIGSTVFFSTDSVLISRLFGVSQVALYANYTLIYGIARGATIGKMISAINPTVGNIVHSNRSNDDICNLFFKIDFLFNLLGVYFSVVFYVLCNVFISLWLGNQYIFSEFFLFLYSIYVYLSNTFEATNTFRAPFGEFEYDRNYFLYSAIFNIVLSIVFAKMFGIIGILLGTIVAYLCICYGRIKFVFNKVLHIKIKDYCKLHFVEFIEFLVIVLIIIVMYDYFKIPNIYIIVKLLIAFCVTSLMFIVRYRGTQIVKDLLDYLKIIGIPKGISNMLQKWLT